MFKALAVVSLGLGILGAFLPVMPTVPFVLLAAWAAARGSLRMSLWMERHPQMGPMIRDWRAGGVVQRRAKWLASLMMAGGAISMSVLVRPWWLPAIGIATMVIIGIWLWKRPEHPPR